MKNYDKVFLHNKGLGKNTGEETIFIDGDSSTLVENKTGKKETVSIIGADDLKKKVGQTIDLMSINIEGAEYSLLDGLLNSDIQINEIIIQFHRIENYEELVKRSRYLLEKSNYTVSWRYDMVWEKWSKK